MLLLLAGTMALLSSPFAIFIASVIALKKAFDWVADKMFAAFVSIVDAIKDVALTMVNKVRGWIGLNPIEGSGPSRKPGESQKDFQKRIDDYTLERLKQPTSYSGATDFSGRRRNADLSESFTKFAGKIERAAFMSGGIGSSQYAAIGGGFNYGSQRKGISLKGTPLHNAVPGQKLPSFGLGRMASFAATVFRHLAVQAAAWPMDFSRSAFEKKFSGTPLAGNTIRLSPQPRRTISRPRCLPASSRTRLETAGCCRETTLLASWTQPMARSQDAVRWPRRLVSPRPVKLSRRTTGALVAISTRWAASMPHRAQRTILADLNGGWPAGVRKQMNALSSGASSGSAGTGDAVGYAEKYKGMNEYSDTRILASALGGDVRGRSNAWCARFVNKAIEQAGGKGTGSAVANSFQRYGSGGEAV